MKRAIIAAITVLPTGLFCTDANAHCFQKWYYPWPQNCGTFHRQHTRTVAMAQPDTPLPPADRPSVDIPLPDLSADWGGALDTELELALQRQKAIRQLKEGGK